MISSPQEKTPMEMEEITIQVPSETARAYRKASKQEKLKMNLLFSFYLEWSKTDTRSLEEVMDDISREAQARGMTPEILEDILGEPIKHIL